MPEQARSPFHHKLYLSRETAPHPKSLQHRLISYTQSSYRVLQEDYTHTHCFPMLPHHEKICKFCNLRPMVFSTQFVTESLLPQNFTPLWYYVNQLWRAKSANSLIMLQHCKIHNWVYHGTKYCHQATTLSWQVCTNKTQENSARGKDCELTNVCISPHVLQQGESAACVKYNSRRCESLVEYI